MGQTIRFEGGYRRWTTYEVDFSDEGTATEVRQLVVTGKDRSHWRRLWWPGKGHSFAASVAIREALRQTTQRASSR